MIRQYPFPAATFSTFSLRFSTLRMLLASLKRLLSCQLQSKSSEEESEDHRRSVYAAALGRNHPQESRATSTTDFAQVSLFRYVSQDGIIHNAPILMTPQTRSLGGDPSLMTQPSHRRYSEDVADRNIHYLALAKHHDKAPFEFEPEAIESPDSASTQRAVTAPSKPNRVPKSYRLSKIPRPVDKREREMYIFHKSRVSDTTPSPSSTNSSQTTSRTLSLGVVPNKYASDESPHFPLIDSRKAINEISSVSSSGKITAIRIAPITNPESPLGNEMTTQRELSQLSTPNRRMIKQDISLLEDSKRYLTRPPMGRFFSSPETPQVKNALEESRMLKGATGLAQSPESVSPIPESSSGPHPVSRTASGRYTLFPTVAFPNSSSLVKDFNNLPVVIRDQKKVKGFFGHLPDRGPVRLQRAISAPARPLQSPPLRQEGFNEIGLAWPFNKRGSLGETEAELLEGSNIGIGHGPRGSSLASSRHVREDTNSSGDHALEGMSSIHHTESEPVGIAF
jgi:hypothetical protein